MATIDDLEFRITASTAGLRGDLARGSQHVEQFANRTSSGFARIDSNIGKSFRSLRQFMAFFGVGIGVNALRSWITGAVRAAEATEKQSAQVRELAEGMKALGAASDSAAIAVGDRLLPAMDLLAGVFNSIRRGVDPTTLDIYTKRVSELRTEIDLLQRQAIILMTKRDEGLTTPENEAAISSLEARIKQLQMNLAPLEAGAPTGRQLTGTFSKGQELSPALRTFIAQQELEDKIARANEERTAAGQPLSRELRDYVAQLERAEEISDSLVNDVEKQVAEWQEAQGLFAQGMLSADEMERMKDRLLQPIEVTAKRLKELKDEGADFAESLGMNFRDAFANWIAGADTSFRQLLKNMAAQMATSAIFKAFGSMFGGATTGAAGFFASFFSGASRATGGDVSGGSVYKVHKGEAFFSPSMDGRIAAAGAGGGGVTIHQSNTFNGGDPRAQAAALAASNRQLKAEISDLQRRGRF